LIIICCLVNVVSRSVNIDWNQICVSWNLHVECFLSICWCSEHWLWNKVNLWLSWGVFFIHVSKFNCLVLLVSKLKREDSCKEDTSQFDNKECKGNKDWERNQKLVLLVLVLLIGELKEQLLELKIKDNVDLAGLSQQLVQLKVATFLELIL